MKIKYREIHLSKQNKERLKAINSIIETYQRDGYVMTLRQLYYQLVTRNIIANLDTEYSKLSILLKEGRMAGIVDWDAIEDRLRVPSKPASFENPQDILNAAIGQYALPRLKGQTRYIEVWVEKDALSGVLKRVTQKYHIPIVINRGYSSVTAMHDAYERFSEGLNTIVDFMTAARQVDWQAYEGIVPEVCIIYLGDFDPSGLDMLRDIEARILEFAGLDWEVFPLRVIPAALTLDQIAEFNPPPNPAKVTDPRAKDFIAKYGSTSYEVDALPPNILNDILEETVLELINVDMYNDVVASEGADKDKLKSLIKHL